MTTTTIYYLELAPGVFLNTLRKPSEGDVAEMRFAYGHPDQRSRSFTGSRGCRAARGEIVTFSAEVVEAAIARARKLMITVEVLRIGGNPMDNFLRDAGYQRATAGQPGGIDVYSVADLANAIAGDAGKVAEAVMILFFQGVDGEEAFYQAGFGSLDSTIQEALLNVGKQCAGVYRSLDLLAQSLRLDLVGLIDQYRGEPSVNDELREAGLNGHRPVSSIVQVALLMCARAGAVCNLAGELRQLRHNLSQANLWRRQQLIGEIGREIRNVCVHLHWLVKLCKMEFETAD